MMINFQRRYFRFRASEGAIDFIMTSTFKFLFVVVFHVVKISKSFTPFILHMYLYWKLNKDRIGVHYWHFCWALENCEKHWKQFSEHTVYAFREISIVFWLTMLRTEPIIDIMHNIQTWNTKILISFTEVNE